MSPTRRDLLAMLGAAGAGAIVPAIAFAEPAIPAVRLRGLGNFFEVTSKGDANCLLFRIETSPDDGSIDVWICDDTLGESRTIISDSPDVARFFADFADAIGSMSDSWNALPEGEKHERRLAARERDWRRGKKPCPVCNTIHIITTLHADPECTVCEGRGFVI